MGPQLSDRVRRGGLTADEDHGELSLPELVQVTVDRISLDTVHGDFPEARHGYSVLEVDIRKAVD
jgi:hypothetical protein